MSALDRETPGLTRNVKITKLSVKLGPKQLCRDGGVKGKSSTALSAGKITRENIEDAIFLDTLASKKGLKPFIKITIFCVKIRTEITTTELTVEMLKMQIQWHNNSRIINLKF